jgi:hypothetical protein
VTDPTDTIAVLERAARILCNACALGLELYWREAVLHRTALGSVECAASTSRLALLGHAAAEANCQPAMGAIDAAWDALLERKEGRRTA